MLFCQIALSAIKKKGGNQEVMEVIFQLRWSLKVAYRYHLNRDLNKMIK